MHQVTQERARQPARWPDRIANKTQEQRGQNFGLQPTYFISRAHKLSVRVSGESPPKLLQGQSTKRKLPCSQPQEGVCVCGGVTLLFTDLDPTFPQSLSEDWGKGGEREKACMCVYMCGVITHVVGVCICHSWRCSVCLVHTLVERGPAVCADLHVRYVRGRGWRV